MKSHLWLTDWKINLGPGSADEFHTVKMVGSPGTSAFSLYIDGGFATSGSLNGNYMISGYNNMASFLSGSTGGVGREVLWNTFDLRTVPEPDSVVLLFAGGLLLALRVKRAE